MGEFVLETFSNFDVTTLISVVLLLVSIICIIVFIVLYAIKTKTEKAIKNYKKILKKAENEVDEEIETFEKNKVADIGYKEYFFEQNIFIEWSKRYFFIIILSFFGIILFIVGSVLLLINRSFFADFSHSDISSFVIGVCTLISTVMIAILQFVNQKNLRLLENSRQGNMSLLAKKEKQENEIFNCFNSLNSFKVYNFANQDSSFLIKQICIDTFGETNIAYDKVSYLIAIPLNKNLSFLNFKIEKINLDNVSAENITDYSTKLSYRLTDNFIFIFYDIKTVMENPIFYCINNYSNKPKFKISMSIKSTMTDLRAIVTMDASISSLIDKQYVELDGIYFAEVHNKEYLFD